MKVIGKRPFCKATVMEIENTLEVLQKEVGGYIETVTFSEDCCIICNDEGRIQGLPYNLRFLGMHFFGTIFFVGVAGDEFTDLNDKQIEIIMKNLC